MKKERIDMEKIGVFLSRMQPLHIGHLGLIEMALKENEKIIILIGSKNKKGTIRNPLSITIRREILEETLKERFKKDYEKRIIVSELPDWSMETDIDSNSEWGRYLYYNIVALGEQKTFSIYFSDDRKIIENWFEDTLKKRVKFRIFERNKMFEAISSTKIRQAFLDGKKEYIEKYCPDAVMKRFNLIKETIEKVYREPKDDYTIK